ncbi:MAG: Do family serine endopeptidase [Labilithrix sp.]|nr:Do family serine endopeptidase [Labilithrix sp.]
MAAGAVPALALAQAASQEPAIQAQPAGPSGDVSALVASVQPAVVNITVEQLAKTSASEMGGESPFDFFFREFGGRGGAPPMMPHGGKRVGAGSGFIIDDKGHVVTNAHVVDGADTVKVKLSDERELGAKVLGKDERLDVAVLEIQGGKNLPHVTLGSSTGLKVGEPVVAIGNPFGLGGTVTSGIVSAKSRTIGAGPYDDFIQTDASINPGNSGGPLFDLRGQVVGMNTAINPSGQGIGFAIPSDAIKEILPQLLEHGHVRRGKLGAHIQAVSEPLSKALALGDTRGALVGSVEKNGPGEKAGLRDGDVVISVDGRPVAHAHDLPRLIASHAPGSKVMLEVRRGTSTVNVLVTLAELGDEKPSAPRREAKPKPGQLGIELGDAKGNGAVVGRVSEGGPAAGLLLPGDVIVEVDRQPVRSAADAVNKIERASVDKPLLLRVEREGSKRWVAIERR